MAKEFATMIFDDDDEHLEKLAHAAKRIRAERFGNAITIYAPLYLSNTCINGCRYCGFNRNNDIRRITLSREDILRELDILIEQGHRHILLVAGEDDDAVPLHLLEEIAATIRPRVASLAVEVRPMNEEEYRRLSIAGVDGVTLYQETYQQDAYRAHHPSGPKSDFAARLNSIEHAGRAGMRTLGIGALLGLADWRRDAIALFHHVRHLQKRFWRSSIAISVPRIRFAPEGFAVPHPVSDADLTRLITSLRCAFPDAEIVLSTREPAELRDNLIPLGITRISAGSRTEPGGYANTTGTGEQFAVEDLRTPAEIAAHLRTVGFDPVFKDWESCLYGG